MPQKGLLSSAYLEPVLLCGGRDDPVHAQILDDLPVVIGDVPHGNDGDPELGVRPGILVFDAVQRK